MMIKSDKGKKVLACVLVVVVLSLGCLQQEMQRSDMPGSSPDSSMPHQDDPFRGTFDYY
jgi:hypothetical protein